MLTEQLERIRTLIYGKGQILTEQNTDQKTELINSLKRIASNGGLSIRNIWQKYSKDLEVIQKSLQYLGYKFPKFGADGMMGSETSGVLKTFIKNNLGSDEPLSLGERVITSIVNNIEQGNSIQNNSIDPISKKPASVSSNNKSEFSKDSFFTRLDLNKKSGFNLYSAICQRFIDTNPPNLLKITGDMLAIGAKDAFNQHGTYVPPELALSQLVLEGGIRNNNPKSRPIRTRNPFNVRNVDSGKNIYHGDVQSGINTYFSLVSRNYLSGDKSPDELLRNFVNLNGNRYASDPDYEDKLKSITKRANQISLAVVNNLDNNQQIS